MNNIINAIATETAETLTAEQRLTVNTGYSSQCGTCETEFYLTRAEWGAIWNDKGNDVPCPVCEGGQPLPQTAEETEAREFLARMQETLDSLIGEARQKGSDAMRPGVRKALASALNHLRCAEDAAYPYRKQ